jgi:vinculin
LHELLKQSAHKAQYYGVNKPSPTLYGKIEQANKWFNNPYLDDNGLGEQAAFMVIEEARKLAAAQKDKDLGEDFLATVFECESLVNQFLNVRGVDNRRLPTDADSQSSLLFVTGKSTQEKFYILGYKITKALIQQVADDFLDINHPIRKLADVITSPPG